MALANWECMDEDKSGLLVDLGVSSPIGGSKEGEWRGEGKGQLSQSPIEWDRRAIGGKEAMGSGNNLGEIDRFFEFTAFHQPLIY